MPRDDEIQAIVEIGRRTRAPVSRTLWIAAAIVGGICTAGLAVALLGEPTPEPGRAQAPAPMDPTGDSAPRPAGGAGRVPTPRLLDSLVDRSSPGSGWGTGLAVGAMGGLVVGFALGRHRRDHSSRSRP
jgi:hypothetical protein